LRTTISPPRTTGASATFPMPRMATSGGLMIGVKSSEPKAPEFVTVNVLPVSSSGVSRPS